MQVNKLNKVSKWWVYKDWSHTSSTASTVSSWSSLRVMWVEICRSAWMDCSRTSSISSLNMSTRKSRHFSAKLADDWASEQRASTAAMRTSVTKHEHLKTWWQCAEYVIRCVDGVLKYLPYISSSSPWTNAPQAPESMRFTPEVSTFSLGASSAQRRPDENSPEAYSSLARSWAVRFLWNSAQCHS